MNKPKVLTYPRVYLVAYMHPHEGQIGELFADHDVRWKPPFDGVKGGDLLPEIAGRLCYWSFDKQRPGGNEAYLKHIKDAEHGSVLEHAVFSFVICAVPRSLTHEFIRHRAGFSYSELSQRYCDPDTTGYVMPPAVLEAGLERAWGEAVTEAHANQLVMTKQLQGIDPENDTPATKKVRQAARSLSPEAKETRIYVTANGRAWRTFLDQRASAGADVQICEVAVRIHRWLVKAAPNLFGDYWEVQTADGRTVLDTPYRKI